MARRSPSARRSCMVLALSNICVLVTILVVLLSGESVWVGVLSLVRILVRSVCTELAVDSISSRVSSAH